MIRFLSIAIVLCLAAAGLAQEKPPASNPLNEPLGEPGVIPVGADGKPLNLNFESGTVEGWKAEGKAFEGQPIKGEIALQKGRPFGEGKKSEHTGQFWVGGYEILRDEPTGTLTSPTFEITHPFCSFLIGGGSHRQTRVDLINANDNKVIYTAVGKDEENLRPVVVDLTKVKGKRMFIRLIDQHTGGWGHVNFDDFRFHEARPKFKTLSSETPIPELTTLYPHAGLSGEEAAKAMVVPPGFTVQLAAQEPDVQQPIAMAIDDRGRIWVAEAYEYPQRANGDKGRDRVLVFEDTDLNGTLDKRTVFYEGLNLVSGLEVGFGGVWVGAAPYLMFIPDKNGDDKPDAEPQILLDGWGYEDTHETLNSFIWGPDGWLYGCHGVFTHSKIGKPGTPADKRVPINAGIWRYHPVRHEFEVFAHGTSNPWGVDFDRYGHAFATACVIPHLWHIIPGARYQRQAGEHFNPYTYDVIKTIAEHRHYVGNQWNNDNRRQSDTLGGGHAHAGAMIYQGGAWPEKYRGQIFMNNIHGNRLNMDRLAAKGSGYVGSAAPDFLLTKDQASQMLYLTYGPDGQVWVIDWYDMQQCHLKEPDKHDRSNGRIYRIVHNDAKPVRVDLREKSNTELIKLLKHENQWYVRHAQRLLQERAAAQKLSAQELFDGLNAELSDPKLPLANRLRKLWAMHSTFGLAPGLRQITGDDDVIFTNVVSDLLSNPEMELGEQGRAWVVRLLLESPDMLSEKLLSDLQKLAAADKPVNVRLAIAAGLQHLPLESRWAILGALTTHSSDAADHNLPLMYWYAMEPLADVDPPRALALAMNAGERIPLLKDFMIRRIGAGDPQKSLALLTDGLKGAKDDSTRLTFLRGMSEALKGRKDIQAPAGWKELFATLIETQNVDLRIELASIGAAFGDQYVIETLRRLVVDEPSNISERQAAIRTLVRIQDPKAAEFLRVSLSHDKLRGDALRGLASFDDAKTPAAVLAIYGQLTEEERRDALATLASRPTYATALLDAVAGGKVPAAHLTADLVTNLRNLNDEGLNKRIEQVWGVVRSSPAEVAKQIEEYKRLVATSADAAAKPDVELGRAIYAKTCQNCHTLFGAGAKIGPDLTGSNRANLDYLLSNVVDPSAVMAKEYQPLVVRLADGRVVTGLKKEETPDSLTLQTQNEVVVIAKVDIEASKQSDKSMMPDNQLLPMSPREIRSLVAYLSSSGQTPMLATPDNMTSFFNGKDLAGWRGNADLWSVENGEIVGKTGGLAKNEFLMSELSVSDFRLELDVKLVGDQGNSGIQIRSEPIEDGLMRGYQCDIGPGWWGKLYEEHGRELLESKGGEQFVKKGDWNHYTIVAAGSRVRTWINGNLCVDRDDPEAARRGIIGLQLHSGEATEVRFKNLNLTLLPSHVPVLPYPASKASAEGERVKVTFKKTTLDRAFRSEGVGMGDFNNDGFLDISAGSVWYENPGPEARSVSEGSPWTMHVLGEKPNSFDIKTYGDTFMNWGEDINRDGRLDLVVVDFPGRQTWWFENPGHASAEPWKRNVVVPVTNDESPLFVDLNGDGQRELVYGDASQRLSLAMPQADPAELWKQLPISSPQDAKIQAFYHGLGIGDINRDGRNDVLSPNGWWEQPPTAGNAVTGVPEPWLFHPAPFGEAQAQMYVFDFDGDGDNDVVGSSAHRRGIWWYERLPEGEWKTHLIDDSIAQTHSLVLADMNGDGLPDLVTGKRFYAHNGRDPGEDEPPTIAWYELSREGNMPKWTKHEFDADSGVGTQFEVHDMNADGLLDVIVANKRGVFYFEQLRH